MSTSAFTSVNVYIDVKPEFVDAFKIASLKNSVESTKEIGISRFDLLQDQNDNTKFLLTEVYKSADAPAAHKQTAHYNAWRATVADMMATPRSNTKVRSEREGDRRVLKRETKLTTHAKYTILSPKSSLDWDYPDQKKAA